MMATSGAMASFTALVRPLVTDQTATPANSSISGLPHVSAVSNSSHERLVPHDLVFLQNLQRYAYGYVMLITCAAGVLGNVLAFAVLSRKSMRASTSATYLRCLAAVDTCVLVLAIFRYRSYYILLSDREVMDVIVYFDRFVQVYVVPFFFISLGLSSFITLSLSLERYLVIRWPFTLKKRCRVGTVRLCTVLAMAAVSLLTLPHFLSYTVHRTTFRTMRVAVVLLDNRYLDARAYLHTFNHYLMPIVWYMAPWLVVAVVNILLSMQVQKSSRIRVGVPNSLNPNRNLSLLIILVVGVYMVCHFPRCILALYGLVNNCSTNNEGSDVSTRSFHLVIAIADILNILNSCLNIVVYCLTGTRFRREVKQLLLCRSCCKSGAAPPPTHQSVHVSLREVPATPLNTRKSFNMSCKELQLARSRLFLCPQASQGHPPPSTSSSPCGQDAASFLSLNHCPASPGSSASSAKEFKDWPGPQHRVPAASSQRKRDDAMPLAPFGKAGVTCVTCPVDSMTCPVDSVTRPVGSVTCPVDSGQCWRPERAEPIFIIAASSGSSPSAGRVPEHVGIPEGLGV